MDAPLKRKFSELANPARFQAWSARALPWFGGAAALLLGMGLFLALFHSPADYQQGESVRIMYVHVPAAWMALFCYTIMAGASAWGFIAKHPLADVAAKETAPIGAVFTALALLTGSLWGKPMWGTWWVWDARLTSVLILFFLYMGYLAVWSAIDDPIKAGRAAAILALAGFVNVPVIHFSVEWWNTLHQPASVFRLGGPTIAPAMLWPLLLMTIGAMALFVALLMIRMQTELLVRRARRMRLRSLENMP